MTAEHSEPSQPRPVASAPPTQPQTPIPGPPQGDATGGVIPYKNTPALIAYYLGIFSLIPCFGFLLSIPAIWLGVVGLKKSNEHPEVKGAAHAWVGIIFGGVCALAWGGSIVWFVISIVMAGA